MTAFNSKEGGFYKTTVGRVQTPTLAILVEREDRIKKFVSRDYWEVHGEFRRRRRRLPRPLVRREVRQGGKDEDAEAKPERLWDAARAEAIRARSAWASPASSPRRASRPRQMSPLLFDLTSLQREANGRFGFSAKHHAVAGAGALRKAQGADLPAHRFARAAGGLPADGQRPWRCSPAKPGKDTSVGVAAYAPFARQVLKERLGQAEQAHLQQRQDLRPLRHHSDAAGAEAICPRPKPSSTTWSPSGSSRCSTRRPSSWSPRASPASRASRSRPKAR